jgi:hypothetical protein
LSRIPLALGSLNIDLAKGHAMPARHGPGLLTFNLNNDSHTIAMRPQNRHPSAQDQFFDRLRTLNISDYGVDLWRADPAWTRALGFARTFSSA